MPISVEKSKLTKEKDFKNMTKEELIQLKGEYAMEISRLKTIKYDREDQFDILVKNKKYKTRETRNILFDIRLLNTDIEILRDYYQICRKLLKEKFNTSL